MTFLSIYLHLQTKNFSIYPKHGIGISPKYEEIIINGRSSSYLADMDQDDALTVMDATLLKKALAEIETPTTFIQTFSTYDCSPQWFPSNSPSEYAYRYCDFNRDKEINIKDSTDIQKYVAGIS